MTAPILWILSPFQTPNSSASFATYYTPKWKKKKQNLKFNYLQR